MIYIYFNYNNICSWQIPFNSFKNSIIYYLNDLKLNNNVINTQSKLINTNFTKNDILILFQINFIYSKGITDEFQNYLLNFKGKIILIISENLNRWSQVMGIDIINQILGNSSVYKIWDYNIQNTIFYKKNLYKRKLIYNPYHPLLEILQYNKKKDIDVYFYGLLNQRRKNIYDKLLIKGYKVLHENTNEKNFYNNLSRSKVIPIIFVKNNENNLNIYRISTLLTNKIFFIHETPYSKDSFNNLLYSDYDNIVYKIEEYLNLSNDERYNIVLNNYNWWKENHHIKKYLSIADFNL